MSDEQQARPIGEVLAETVRTYRERAGLRQDDLAERTAQLGHPMSRVTLAKIEAGGTRADNATLDDVLVLAAALDVPPPLLFLPLGSAEAVAIAPGLVAHPQVVLDWLAGEDDLRDSVPWTGHIEAWSRNVHPVRMFRGLRERQDAAARDAAEARGLEEQGKDAEAVQARHRLDRSLASLGAWLEAMRSAGLAVPDMPDEWQARIAELDT